jgi:hypothetical protein
MVTVVDRVAPVMFGATFQSTVRPPFRALPGDVDSEIHPASRASTVHAHLLDAVVTATRPVPPPPPTAMIDSES